MPDLQRISIGFQASPPIALRMPQSALDKHEKALGGDGWHVLEGEDGTLRLSLENVLWVRVENDEHRVGFGLST